MDFGADFGISDIKTFAGGTDIFITRINANGGYGWTRSMGGASGIIDRGYSITTDSTGNFYVTGIFGGTVNFGADFGAVDTKTSAGDDDIFITKLQASVLLPIFDGHDFDGNGASDVSVWRPSNGRWYIKSIGNYIWGMVGDIPLVR